MPAINPELLVWTRETAGLTLQDAVAKVGIKDARGVAAVDRLTALERGDETPTRPVLVKMAHHYRRPLLAFYLNAPPRRDERGPDFRTLPGARSSETDALVDALVRNLRSRQNMVRAALQAENEAEPLPFVGALLRNEDTDAVSSRFAEYSDAGWRPPDCRGARSGCWTRRSVRTWTPRGGKEQALPVHHKGERISTTTWRPPGSRPSEARRSGVR